jgi:hypothetical protein
MAATSLAVAVLLTMSNRATARGGQRARLAGWLAMAPVRAVIGPTSAVGRHISGWRGAIVLVGGLQSHPNGEFV